MNYLRKYGPFFLIIFVARVILIWIYPLAPLDSAFSLTPAFSAILGVFPVNSFVQNTPANLFGYLAIPFFIILKGKYSLFVFYELGKLFLCYQICLLSKSQNKLNAGIVFIVLIFSDRLANYYGEEIILSAMIVYLVRLGISKRFFLYILSVTLLFVLHPVAAISLVVLVFALKLSVKGETIESSFVMSHFIILIILAAYLKLSIFGEQIILYSSSKYNTFNFSYLVNYLKISFPILLFLAVLMTDISLRLFAILIFLVSSSIAFFCFLQGYYYFHYLVIEIVVLWIFSDANDLTLGIWKERIAQFSIGTSLIIFLLFPTFLLFTSKNQASAPNVIFNVLQKVPDFENKKHMFPLNLFCQGFVVAVRYVFSKTIYHRHPQKGIKFI